MLRNVLFAIVLCTAAGVAGILTVGGRSSQPPAEAYLAVERDVLRLAAEGERLVALGDACLAGLQAPDKAAVNGCRSFLEDAVLWAAPLEVVGRKVAALEAEWPDARLSAAGAGREKALAAFAALDAVTYRLTRQVSRVDAWLRRTAHDAQVVLGDGAARGRDATAAAATD